MHACTILLQIIFSIENNHITMHTSIKSPTIRFMWIWKKFMGIQRPFLSTELKIYLHLFQFLNPLKASSTFPWTTELHFSLSCYKKSKEILLFKRDHNILNNVLICQVRLATCNNIYERSSITYQCQLFTFLASALSSTIHLGSPSPHLAMSMSVKHN